jgi:hypothetical protein
MCLHLKQIAAMNRYQILFGILLLFLFPCCTSLQKTATVKSSGNNNPLPGWAFGGFQRPLGVNPIISPDPSTSFVDPMTGKTVHWESNDTFNPGAAIKDNQVVLLYRAEDKSGIAIGERTSRLGYAESSDGIHFSRNATSVLFPADDTKK